MHFSDVAREVVKRMNVMTILQVTAISGIFRSPSIKMEFQQTFHFLIHNRECYVPSAETMVATFQYLLYHSGNKMTGAWMKHGGLDVSRILQIASELVRLLWFRLIGRVKWQSKSNTYTNTHFLQLIFVHSSQLYMFAVRTRCAQLCKRLIVTDFRSAEGLSACIACICLF